MSDITSVNVMKRGKSKVPFLWVIGGLLLTLWVVIDETRQFAEFFNIGILLMISGIVLFIIAKPTYTVHVGSALGESNILRSTNLTFIQRVVEALNNALALRK